MHGSDMAYGGAGLSRAGPAPPLGRGQQARWQHDI